jgi:hypothetical protein
MPAHGFYDVLASFNNQLGLHTSHGRYTYQLNYAGMATHMSPYLDPMIKFWSDLPLIPHPV